MIDEFLTGTVVHVDGGHRLVPPPVPDRAAHHRRIGRPVRHSLL
ncbi:hypothetical protein [Nocardia sp. alder85J]|nr:hypothetical protein [Nocardia sp. alder85J]MCX4092905.1 hypothetical protein [Nocardia sp. alder85J]